MATGSDITGVNHVTLVVADLDRALGFYCERLGLRSRARGPRLAYLEGGALWLCLELGQPQPAQDDSHIAFSVTPEGFARLTARLSDAPRWKANRSEGASLYLQDPDGHKLELHVGTLASRLAHYAKTNPEIEILD
ncbi:VOC family protein [Roseibaca sp. Y0-43]|uniref:VOC family protein n=1 Tax=Roseibaca sp. Y0-43 TaxID=2816854 RepID=UPI001D0C3900|nr:VOC family protein [Roseibaca sp. Y0-43]MCC1480488.1 VOC family protein [Roseibaca sp. Y0-43]